MYKRSPVAFSGMKKRDFTRRTTEAFPYKKIPDELVKSTMCMGMFADEYVPWMRKISNGLNTMFKFIGRKCIETPNSIIPDRPKEELYRMRRVLPIDGKDPFIGDNCFIAPSAVVLGDVYLCRKNYIGYNTVIRADNGHRVEIGESSNVQDKAVVIGNTTVGKWVSIEPMAIVDSADIGSNSMIGASAIVMPGARVESGCMLCAAAVLRKGETVRSGEIWAGNPAQKIGELTEKEREYIIRAAKHHVLLNVEHHDSWALCWEEWEDIRLSRETWALWAEGSLELRIKPHYIREPPSIKNRANKGNTTIQEAGEGRIGSAEIPHYEGTVPGGF